jgi:hypothetical protein
LYKDCKIWIVSISSDRYQSSFIAQAVQKDGKEYTLLSVDKDKTPYLMFKTKVLNGNIKIGYYVNILNNFRSLIETKEKIDHIQNRKDDENNKNIGLESKDITDSLAGNSFILFNNYSKYSIQYNYDDINRMIEFRKNNFTEKNLSNMDESKLYSSLLRHIEYNNSYSKDRINKKRAIRKNKINWRRHNA